MVPQQKHSKAKNFDQIKVFSNINPYQTDAYEIK